MHFVVVVLLLLLLLLSLETFISEGKIQELEECSMALFKDAKFMRAELSLALLVAAVNFLKSAWQVEVSHCIYSLNECINKAGET